MEAKYREKIRLTNPTHLLAVGLGSGLSPVSPGTMGSLVAIPIWLLFYHVAPVYYWIIIAVATIYGCWICDKTAKDMGTHDHGGIVWDEFVGMWITLFFIPQFSVFWIVIAFAAFRLFDIVKPWPIRWFDRHVHGGIGIMVDDIVAAVFSSAVVWALGAFF
ncbi:phosphatidylglycerophosphatase A family protein [Zophobihabitans entericus]|uniref:Phosphatidylglycerophosphatase A n=1 Tax=Zophobihabitans entericus TaxID=1635327 RepID=A0A6G9I905_9GAMM|nr:phosphatidylglycerophosphatase A [Zophobihabitans entericus]QIQ20696.1 phosphatidylglycerophosphatase A [Zophobihabitans entericus]